MIRLRDVKVAGVKVGDEVLAARLTREEAVDEVVDAVAHLHLHALFDTCGRCLGAISQNDQSTNTTRF